MSSDLGPLGPETASSASDNLNSLSLEPPKQYTLGSSEVEDNEHVHDDDSDAGMTGQSGVVGNQEDVGDNVTTSAIYDLQSYPGDDPSNQVLEQRTTFSSELDRYLYETPMNKYLPDVDINSDYQNQPKPVITITEAVKSHDLGGSSYIGYIIHTDLSEYGTQLESKHRYSEFESLRKLLVKAYPTCVVPPIPEKHSVKDYMGKPGRAKEDPKMILKRKRMLQSFLNRVASHPILSGANVLHRFLKGAAPWSEIVATSGLAHLLKGSGPLAKVNDRTHLRKPDPHFKAAEDYTRRFTNQMGYIIKIYKRIFSHLEIITEIQSQLGAAYNGWSLTETTLSQPLEQTGQSIDSMVTLTQVLASQVKESFGEGLLEYANFAHVIEKLLLWRHRKHGQFEATSESLIHKQTTLAKLESSEHESQRLNAVLAAEGSQYVGTRPPVVSAAATTSSDDVPQTDTPEAANTNANGANITKPVAGYGSGVPIGAPSSTSYPSSGSLGGGFFSTLNAFIDHDPEQTRRNNISKTKDAITSLEDARETIRQELLTSNLEIQRELDRFQRQKIRDFKTLLLGVIVVNREYHRKALQAWRGAKDAIDTM